jgi:hypothetical protein
VVDGEGFFVGAGAGFVVVSGMGVVVVTTTVESFWNYRYRPNGISQYQAVQVLNLHYSKTYALRLRATKVTSYKVYNGTLYTTGSVLSLHFHKFVLREKVSLYIFGVQSSTLRHHDSPLGVIGILTRQFCPGYDALDHEQSSPEYRRRFNSSSFESCDRNFSLSCAPCYSTVGRLGLTSSL